MTTEASNETSPDQEVIGANADAIRRVTTKTSIIRLRATTGEKTDWTSEAKRSSVSLSAWIRQSCNNAKDKLAESRENQTGADGSILLDRAEPA